jgi:aminopeptidase
VSIAGDVKAAPSTAPDTPTSADVFLRNEHLEETRVAAAKGARALKELPLLSEGQEENAQPRRTIALDSFTSAHAAATGALLALWKVNHFKTKGPSGAFAKEYEERSK